MIEESDLRPRDDGSPPAVRIDIELMRIVSILMVIAIHSTGPTIVVAQRSGELGPAYWLSLVANEASRPGVPVFFAITGWALLRRSTPGDVDWLGQRVARLAVPLLIWSTIQVVDSILVAGAIGNRLWEAGGELAWLGNVVAGFLDGSGTRTSLWFLYYALALTIAIWLIQAARSSSGRDRTIYTAIAAGLILAFGFAAAAGVTLRWQAFGWALGYAALGYAVLESAPRRLLGALAYIVGAGATVVGIAALGYDTWPSLYFSPMVLLATLGALWALTRIKLAKRWEPWVVRLGALTFGVYLVHPLVLDVLRLSSRPGGVLHQVPLSVRVLLTWAVAVVVSFALVALWHRSRTLARILG